SKRSARAGASGGARSSLRRARPAAKRARHVDGRSGEGPRAKAKSGRKWSAGVMARSDAMDLEQGVFKSRSARQVALSLKRSAESSHRRKSTPFRSAMSMLNFEINRGGKNLSAERKRVLNQAKVELRKVFHREPARR
ncbi:MAG TPA: DUF3175 domain-containing protein, partial [Steroidobacteraceae bacterium]